MDEPDLLQHLLEAHQAQSAAAGDRRRIPARRRAAVARPPVSPPRQPSALRHYQRGRASMGIAFIGLLFVAAWLLNGYFTARFIAGLGGDWALGVSVHLITTMVELTTVFVSPILRRIHAPGWVHLLIWLIVLPFGIIDTGTSALGLLEWGLALGLPLALSLQVGATLLALMIAFLPEPMLVWLTAALQAELSQHTKDARYA